MGAVSADFHLLDDRLKKLNSSSMNIEELIGGGGSGGDDESQPSVPSSSEHDEEDRPSSSEIKRSVEEVWKEIQEGKVTSAAAASSTVAPQRTLGEMTLEEFLVKSGVAEGGTMGSTFPDDLGGDAVLPAPHKRERDDLDYMQGMGMGMDAGGSSGSKRLRGFVAKIESCCMVPGSGELLSYGDAFPQGPKAEECYVDKVAERRQRRMIKNRESAARSRARKQAYTAELEAEVTLLKEENEKLKRQHAEDARQRTKMIDILTVLKRSKKNAKAQRVELRRVSSF